MHLTPITSLVTLRLVVVGGGEEFGRKREIYELNWYVYFPEVEIFPIFENRELHSIMSNLIN